MNNLQEYILEQVSAKNLDLSKAQELLSELKKTAASNRSGNSDMAIIGMAGMFPQSENVDEFWENLRDGKNCIGDFPEVRKQDTRHLLENPSYTEYVFGKPIPKEEIDDCYAKAGYLRQTDKFDSDFFGIPAAEACYMDPCQRLVLQTAWSAMEDAGYGGDSLYGSNTGIFIGKEATNLSHYRYAAEPHPTQLTGSWESVIGSRISYLYDFKGPCMLVDTACSASLVSVHMAAKSIQNGECEVAIAGGVNIIPGEVKSKYLSVMSMDSVESDSGVVRTFDADANGTVWGEGVAMVLIKTLEQALSDGDHIHAVIKGSAINNDGSSNGLTAPKAESQESVILKAWESAGIDPETINYIEAHGTGTVLGDPIEFKGLTNAFKKTTDKKQFCAIGSMKTNMGHLVATSGVASLFKVVKSMKAGKIAPTINFNKPNPYINFIDGPLYIADQLQDWPSSDTPKRAAISSFGFSHTNCHMVIEEAPDNLEKLNEANSYIFSLSARKQQHLLEYIDLYRRFCKKESWNLPDICYTSAVGRGHYEHRLCIVSSTKDEFMEKLASCSDLITGLKDEVNGVFYGHHTVVSDRKVNRENTEITASKKSKLSEASAIVLDRQNGTINTDTLLEIAPLYCSGADLSWSDIFVGDGWRRLSQPTYPYEQSRRWVINADSKIQSNGTKIHPLIDCRVSASEHESVYESFFSSASHWELADHKIKGTSVVPGTTYLEMFRAVAAHALFTSKVKLSDIFFLQPMIVNEDETRTVRITISRNEKRHKVEISSCSTDDKSNWISHAEAYVEEASLSDSDWIDLSSIKNNADKHLDDYQIELDTGVFQFGPHWDSIRETWTSSQQSLAKLVLPDDFSDELLDYSIHPSMLDNAMNLTSQDGDATYLPYMYKSFTLLKPFKKEMYTIIMPTSGMGDDEEIHSYDVILADYDGSYIAKIEGYSTKKVNSFDFATDASHDVEKQLGVQWVQFDRKRSISLFDLANTVVVIGAGGESVSKLCYELKESRLEVRSVDFDTSSRNDSGNAFTPDEVGVEALINSSVLDNADAIIFATDYDYVQDSTELILNAESFANQRQLGVDALFYLGKKLANSNRKLHGGIIVLTKSAFSVQKNESPRHPLGSSTAMFAKVLDDESPGLDIYSIDVDIDEEEKHTVKGFESLSPTLIVAQRSEQLYVQQLHPKKELVGDTYEYKKDGLYIITGGLGGLGMRIADHIAQQAQSHVVLLGRSDLPEREVWQTHALDSESTFQDTCAKLLALQDKLASIEYHQVDSACHLSMDTFSRSMRDKHAEIAGIFHAAGVAGDGFVLNKSFSRYDAVLSPKLMGTRNLLEFFKDDDLDFLALFSSITAIVGGQGQSDYAAANTFLDSVSSLGNALEVPIVCVNWPSWEDTGMAVDFNIDHEKSPFKPIHSNEAMRNIDIAIDSKLNQLVPTTINRDGLKIMLDDLPITLSSELTRQIENASSTEINYESLIENIEITGKSEEELTVTEVSLSKLYAGVLGTPHIDIYTSFQDMGGNSILATHLLKVIDKYFPGKIELSDIFTYTSVEQMAEYIAGSSGTTNSDIQPASDSANQAKTSALEGTVDAEQPELDGWGMSAPMSSEVLKESHTSV